MKKLLTVILFLTTSTFCFATSNEQSEALMRFAGNIHQFNSIYPQEKVYLQFDNTSYYAGETIWFKAFVVEASTLNRAPSRVLYVDLISPGGVVLQQEKLKIVAGQADGSFPLVDAATSQVRSMRGITNYPSGFYEIRAYTNNMLNFKKETVFSRVFAVYEQPSKEGEYYTEKPVIKQIITNVEQYRPETKKPNKINLSFYPEGGHLIIGKPCRIAFKATDESGFGTSVTGKVNDTDITFSTIHNGMGSFTFTPTAEKNSVTIVTTDGTERRFNLPDAELTGVSLSVTNHNSINLAIECTEEFTEETLGVTLTCRGEIMDFFTIDINNNTITKQIATDGIPEGVCRVTVFDREGRIYASRFIYNYSNIAAPQISIIPDKAKYNGFDPMKLSILLLDGNGKPFKDRFCLSVRDQRGFSNIYTDDIRTSLLLSSDLKGLVENPEYYFESRDSIHTAALDLLMMIQGWERYDWRTMAGIESFVAKHRIETGLTLNGWVLNPSGKKPLGDATVLAAIVPENRDDLERYTYHTDSTGYFGFDIGVDFYNTAKLTIYAQTEKERLIGTSARLLFERSLTPEIRAYQPGETVFSTTQRNNEIKKVGREKIDETEEEKHYPTIIKENEGYLLPDVDIESQRKYIDYYTFKAFDVTKDVEIELDKAEHTTDVFGYLLAKGYQVYSVASDTSDTADTVYVDGYPAFFYVHNNSKYLYQGKFEIPLNIDTKDLKGVLVYDRVVTLGEAYTLSPLYQEFQRKTQFQVPNYEFLQQRVRLVDIYVKEDHELNSRKEIINIDKRISTVTGYSEPYSFYSPEYPDGPILGDVDYRRTLYWNPNVITNENGQATVELYNNSITGSFNISAAGITAGGQPYSFDQDF